MLSRIDAAVGLVGTGGRRHVPSAGACYPYEVVVSSMDGRAVGRLDLVRRTVTAKAEDLHALEADRLRWHVIGRPWLSMRRYARRGYLYHLIDVGHALFNLSLVSATAGPEPIVPVVGGDQPRPVLGSGVISATSIDGWVPGPKGAPQSSGPAAWTVLADERIWPPRPEFEEMLDPLLPGEAPLLRVAGTAPAPFLDLIRAVPTRHSASHLGVQGGVDVWSQALNRIRDLSHLLVAEFGVEVPQMEFFSPQVRLPGAQQIDADWARSALFGQENLVHAGVFVVMTGLVRQRAKAPLTIQTQVQLMSCGLVGEICYLVASQLKLGVTGVGGFDARRWSQVCGGGREALYILALGCESAGLKYDRVRSTGGHLH